MFLNELLLLNLLHNDILPPQDQAGLNYSTSVLQSVLDTPLLDVCSFYSTVYANHGGQPFRRRSDLVLMLLRTKQIFLQ
jgi:hypothetical protein